MGRKFQALLAKIRVSPGVTGLVQPIDIPSQYEFWTDMLRHAGTAGNAVLALLGSHFETDMQRNMNKLILWTSKNIHNASNLYNTRPNPRTNSTPPAQPPAKIPKQRGQDTPSGSNYVSRGERCHACQSLDHKTDQCVDTAALASLKLRQDYNKVKAKAIADGLPIPQRPIGAEIPDRGPPADTRGRGNGNGNGSYGNGGGRGYNGRGGRGRGGYQGRGYQGDRKSVV